MIIAQSWILVCAFFITLHGQLQRHVVNVVSVLNVCLRLYPIAECGPFCMRLTIQWEHGLFYYRLWLTTFGTYPWFWRHSCDGGALYYLLSSTVVLFVWGWLGNSENAFRSQDYWLGMLNTIWRALHYKHYSTANVRCSTETCLTHACSVCKIKWDTENGLFEKKKSVLEDYVWHFIKVVQTLLS